MHIYDILIIGGGPAGYTAALYAARAGLDTLIIEKMSSDNQNTNLSVSADTLIDSIYNSIKGFEKEAINAGREYSSHRMNQCIAVSIYGVSIMAEIKTLVIFAAFAYISIMLYSISKKLPKKA